jgi:hypothetical protein
LARAAGWPGQVSGKFGKKESADFGTIFFFFVFFFFLQS